LTVKRFAAAHSIKAHVSYVRQMLAGIANNLDECVVAQV